MPLLLLTFLLIYTFGAVAFAALLVLSFGQWRKSGGKCADGPNAAILFASAVWFWVNLIVTFKEMYQEPADISNWYAFLMGIACVFPPLMMRVFYREEERFLPPSRLWIQAIWIVQFLSLALVVLAVSLFAGWAPLTPLALMRTFSLGLFFLFFIAAVYAVCLRRKSSRPHEGRERKEHRWTLVMLGLTVALFLLIIASIFHDLPYGRVIGLASRALPLGFISVGTYFRSRFDFFDAFVKQGAYFLLALIVLTALFTGVAPAVEQLELGWARAWVYAIFMLPIVFASPWVYRRLSEWLDRVWLGRRFTTVEAVKYFLSEVKEASTEEDLVERGQKCLATIMQAPTRLSLGPEPMKTDFEPELETTIPAQGEPIGHIRMGKRSSDEPFFSQDVALVSSLADVFYSLLATIRLQARKQEQEKREQELIINAGRSELKALRAQINPHFLFNALNAIAGLIERDPARAEETVERLAEVFRYTLRRSESEWVYVGDELEFIQAYLEIEQARFGDRLHVSLQAPDSVRELRIPAMMIQTLVENAIKHGVASVRGPGIVKVNAVRENQTLRIDVLDNGPGFELDDQRIREPEGKHGGYGLKNVRQRLSGYFGEDGKLEVSRDEPTGYTRVSIFMPVSELTPEQVLYDSNASRR